MKILSRYMGLTLIKAMLLVLLVLAGVEIFILLATQLHNLGKGSYNLWRAIGYVLLVLPQETYFLFPMAALLGMLFGLSLLANHGELVSMRAAGISPQQIAMYGLSAGLLLTACMMLIGEGIGPIARHYAENNKLLATSSAHALAIRQGLWIKQAHNFYYINKVYSPHEIGNVSQYQFDDHQQLQSASVAAIGKFIHQQWQMTDVHESLVTPQQIITKHMPSLVWDLSIDPRLLEISLIQPSEMSLRQLAEIIHYQTTHGLSASHLQLIFWQRMLQPLSSLIMMFLAIPFMFGPLRHATTGLRLVAGVMMGFVFYLFNQLFPPLSQVYNFAPLIAVLIPPFLFLLIGVMMLRRIG